MHCKQKHYFIYQSLIDSGKHIRKLKRTQLSCSKTLTNKRSQFDFNRQIIAFKSKPSPRSKSSRSVPKIQTSHRLYNENENGKKNQKLNRPQTMNQFEGFQTYFGASQNRISPNTSIRMPKSEKLLHSHSHKTQKNTQECLTNPGIVKQISRIKQKDQYNDCIEVQPNRETKLTNERSSNLIKKANKIQSQLSSKQSSDFKMIKSKEKVSFTSRYSHKTSEAYFPISQQKEEKLSKMVNQQSPFHKQSSEIYFNEQLSQIKQKDSRNLQQQIESSNFSLTSNKYAKQSINWSKTLQQNDKNKINHVQISKLNQISDVQSVRNSQFGKHFLPMLNLNSVNSKNSDNEVNNFQSKRVPLRNSFRNLPLSSREPSRRSIRESMDRPFPNTIEEIIEGIQIHSYILALLLDFKEQTARLYSQHSEDWELFCFLMQKKYFYESSKMVKALKGGKNIFTLSSTQIPTSILKQHLDHPKLKQIIKQHQENNIVLFKKLRTFYQNIKYNHRNNPLFVLQTPNDRFTSFIVKKLHDELFQVYEQLLSSRLSEGSQIQKQVRIIEIIQIIFLLVELHGKKVRKIQFADEIEDFDIYYDKNLPKLMQVMEYFQEADPDEL